MNQYIIKMQDGKPSEHPMILENFVQCFPEIDLANLPSTFAYFEKNSMPILGPYQELHSIIPDYIVREDGIVEERWVIREYSSEERARLIELRRAEIHPAGWIFNEETCSYETPIPYPDDGQRYVWDDATENWVVFQD